MGPESEISDSLKKLKPERNLIGIFTSFVHISLAHEAMDLSLITLPLVENKCN